MKKIFLILSFIFFLQTISLAGNIFLSVDNSNLVVGETTNLKITISNISSSSTPELKNINSFRINFIGTSTNVSIINGNFKSEKVYNYAITPAREGKFTIGPAIIKDKKGNIYKSNTVTINVSNSNNKNQAQHNSSVFIELSVNKNNVKINEEIILSVKIFRQIEVYNMSIKVPDLNDFIVNKLTDAKEYIDIRHSQKYYVTELKYSLFPTQTGNFIIPPFILYGNVLVDSFFKNPFNFNNGRQISIPSNSINIKVSPLKENIFAVGDYNFYYEADKTKVLVGNSITITFKIFGYGNLKLASSIKLPAVKGLKYYPDKPQISIKKTVKGIYSEKIEKIAVIPEDKGEYKIPAIKLKVYNPKTKQVENIKLPAIKINVSAKRDEQLKVVENNKKSLPHIKKDVIDTIITDFKIENQNIRLNCKNIFLFFILPLAILFSCYLLKYFYLFRKANYKKIIKSNAFNIFKKELNSSKNIDELSSCIKRYFLNKTANNSKSITFKEALHILSKHNIDNTIISDFRDTFKAIEQAQFARIEDTNFNEVKHNIFELIKKIDKVIIS